MESQKHPFYALHLRRPEEKKEELVRAASDKNLCLIFFLFGQMEALVRELMEVRSIGIFIGGLLVTMIILSILINFCQVSTFVT